MKQIPESLFSRLEAFFTSASESNQDFVFNALAKVYHVEDGDTWKGRRKPDPTIETTDEYYRLDDIDTWETDAKKEKRRKRAKAHKQFTEEFVKRGETDWDGDWPFVLLFADLEDRKSDYGGAEVEGTYGRPIADLKRRSDGRWLSQALVDEFGDEVKPDSTNES